VGGYRLLRPLGAGGMGTVYEAEEASTGRRVALKLIRAEFADSPDAVERFRREGRLASTIVHPRCVFVQAADEEGGRPYIVMELMPGPTLQELVERGGPLPVPEAVSRVLDVVDGLLGAHRAGVVHRDVKPSNCFLGPDGRVKVGDFGLAKSLLAGSHLTRTGAFLGTPLYAAPEQVKGEAVGPQADVYSAAATLYFLLTGRAPHQGGDAAATLARIVSEPAPPLRTWRKGLSPGLDRVVLRGLERDRKRRWRDLEEFRQALLPFAPGGLTAARPGWRLGAYLLDSLLLTPLVVLTSRDFLRWAWGTGPLGRAPTEWGGARLALTLAAVIPWLLYFVLLEGLWGQSLGKRWLRLRVCTPDGVDPPGLARALVRTLLWYSLTLAPVRLLLWYRPAAPLVYLGLHVGGVLLVLSTMRARNGYRGPHELLSGTRVVRLPPRPAQRRFGGRVPEPTSARAEGIPERVGSFLVRGVFPWSAGRQFLLAEDPALGRRVLLWLRPPSEPPLEPQRWEVNRPTRLRWLASGCLADRRWDAFLAPVGRPLSDLVAGGRLGWPEARLVLEQLAAELVAAGGDGSLPRVLTPDQVWVGPEGQVQLLDAPLAESRTPGTPVAASPPSGAALSLLAGTAVLALEGRTRSGRGPVRAPVPEHARGLLDRLLGAGPPYTDVAQLEADLAATRGQSAEVTRPHRAAHLVTLAALHLPGLGWMLLVGWLASLIPLLYLGWRGLEGEHIRQAFGHWAGLACAVSALDPAPGPRLHGAVQWQADQDLLARLENRQGRLGRERQARLRSLAPFNRWLSLKAVGVALDTVPQAPEAGEFLDVERRVPHLRADAQDAAHVDRFHPDEVVGLRNGVIIGLVAWPALWVLWAGLTRGGICFRLYGLTLLRADGRRAGRFRCAWRALLVWALPVAALVGSVCLDAWYWARWDLTGPNRWALWLSWLAWWLGTALVPLWLGLALYSPRRGLHDRLAGTYMMPR
jgi:hypothetical protein